MIYEIVWYQLLQLAIGSTAVSLGILLATFMGGLCIGSLGLPRLRRAQTNPLRTYAILESGMAVCGVLVLINSVVSSRTVLVNVPETLTHEYVNPGRLTNVAVTESTPAVAGFLSKVMLGPTGA